MPKQLDLIGQKYGFLTVLEQLPSKNGKTYWLCQCDCGEKAEVQGARLRNGTTQSCGHLNKSNTAKEKFDSCLNCGEKLPRKNAKYCSTSCQMEYQRKEYIKRWKEGLETGLSGQYAISKHIRKYLFEKYNNKCCKCGWGEVNPFSGTLPLEVEHQDGDYKNNKEENLLLLCPNCHSLTSTYKGANKGNGRQERQKYT